MYGCRKLTLKFTDLGIKVNRKLVKRLIQIISWQTIYREPQTTISNNEHKKYPCILNGLKITHKNQVLAVDMTRIPTKGFMYLTVIIDLHTRFVLNCILSNTMSAY